MTSIWLSQPRQFPLVRMCEIDVGKGIQVWWRYLLLFLSHQAQVEGDRFAPPPNRARVISPPDTPGKALTIALHNIYHLSRWKRLKAILFGIEKAWSARKSVLECKNNAFSQHPIKNPIQETSTRTERPTKSFIVRAVNVIQRWNFFVEKSINY